MSKELEEANKRIKELEEELEDEQVNHQSTLDLVDELETNIKKLNQKSRSQDELFREYLTKTVDGWSELEQFARFAKR